MYFKNFEFTCSGIHAREWISPATATLFMKELVSRSQNSENVIDLLKFYDIFIMPVGNPDG